MAACGVFRSLLPVQLSNVNINKNGSKDFKLVKTRYVELIGNWCKWGKYIKNIILSKTLNFHWHVIFTKFSKEQNS